MFPNGQHGVLNLRNARATGPAILYMRMSVEVREFLDRPALFQAGILSLARNALLERGCSVPCSKLSVAPADNRLEQQGSDHGEEVAHDNNQRSRPGL
jgi:hypothetical protein